jgi:hypothetical protein
VFTYVYSRYALCLLLFALVVPWAKAGPAQRDSLPESESKIDILNICFTLKMHFVGLSLIMIRKCMVEATKAEVQIPFPPKIHSRRMAYRQWQDVRN